MATWQKNGAANPHFNLLSTPRSKRSPTLMFSFSLLISLLLWALTSPTMAQSQYVSMVMAPSELATQQTAIKPNFNTQLHAYVDDEGKPISAQQAKQMFPDAIPASSPRNVMRAKYTPLTLDAADGKMVIMGDYLRSSLFAQQTENGLVTQCQKNHGHSETSTHTHHHK